VARELNDKELSGPVVQKMLLDEVDRLETELSSAKQYLERFYEADKAKAVLEERVKESNSYEILYNGCIIGGSILLGFVPNIWNSQPLGIIIAIVGVVLVVGALWSKKARA